MCSVLCQFFLRERTRHEYIIYSILLRDIQVCTWKQYIIYSILLRDIQVCTLYILFYCGIYRYIHGRRQIELVRSKSSDKLDYMFASRCRHSRRNATSERCVDRSQYYDITWIGSEVACLF